MHVMQLSRKILCLPLHGNCGRTSLLAPALASSARSFGFFVRSGPSARQAVVTTKGPEYSHNVQPPLLC